jgi:uncharacterized protein
LRPSLLVPILPAEAEGIEEYAVDVFNNWKLGQKGHNNGVLVVVVPQDRKMRIEVGTTRGKNIAAAAPEVARQPVWSRNGFQRADMPWPQRILLSPFVFTMIGLFTFVGIVTPGVGWFLYVFLIPFWSMFPLMPSGQHRRSFWSWHT